MNIKGLRQEQGKTQQQIAEQVGVSQATVNRWEKEIRHPRLAHLKKLAEILSCKIDDLI